MDAYRKEALKATNQLQKQREGTKCSVNSTILLISAKKKNTTLSTFFFFLRLPQDMVPLLFLLTWRPSICSFSPLPFFHHFRFFFLPMRAFKADLCSPWKELLRVTKTASQSQCDPGGLGCVSLIFNDIRKPEMDFRVTGDNYTCALTCQHMLT